MNTELKPAIYRYGVFVDSIGVLFGGTTVANRPMTNQSLLRINEELGAIEFSVNGAWNVAKASAVSALNTQGASFNLKAGVKYYVLTETTTLVLPTSPNVGDEVELVDQNLNFNSINRTVESNKSIMGSNDDYVLDRKADVVTFRYEGGTFGWSVSHMKPKVQSVMERFDGSETITQAVVTEVPVNKIVYISVSSTQTVPLELPVGEEGDEIHLLNINDSGAGSLPSAVITVKAGETFNAVPNASTFLGGKGAWLKLKYLGGWKEISRSKERVLTAGRSLNDFMFRSGGKFYVDNITGGLPDGLSSGITGLLDVKEGREFSNTSSVTEWFQDLYVPSLGRSYSRFKSNYWEQTSPLNKAVTQGDLELTVGANTHVYSTAEETVAIGVTGPILHGDRLVVTTPQHERTEAVLSITKLNGVTVNGYRVSGPNRTVAFRYDGTSSSWMIESDSNPLLIGTKTLTAKTLAWGTLAVRGKKHFKNAVGELPSKVKAGDNELIVETITRADASLENNNEAMWGTVDLLDCDTGDKWIRRFDDTGWLGGWRLQNGCDIVTFDDSVDETVPVSFTASEITVVSKVTHDYSLSFAENLSDVRPGDRILIRNLTDFVITLTGITVIDQIGVAETPPNTLTGKGDVSGYFDEDKNLVILSAIKRSS